MAASFPSTTPTVITTSIGGSDFGLLPLNAIGGSPEAQGGRGHRREGRRPYHRDHAVAHRKEVIDAVIERERVSGLLKRGSSVDRHEGLDGRIGLGLESQSRPRWRARRPGVGCRPPDTAFPDNHPAGRNRPPRDRWDCAGRRKPRSGSPAGRGSCSRRRISWWPVATTRETRRPHGAVPIFPKISPRLTGWRASRSSAVESQLLPPSSEKPDTDGGRLRDRRLRGRC